PTRRSADLIVFRIFLWWALSSACVWAGSSSDPGGQLRSCTGIMPLGDSITVGVNGGYRNDLYTGFRQTDCGVSYVGTLSDPNTRVADKNHEGHAGLTIGDIAS